MEECHWNFDWWGAWWTLISTVITIWTIALSLVWNRTYQIVANKNLLWAKIAGLSQDVHNPLFVLTGYCNSYIKPSIHLLLDPIDTLDTEIEAKDHDLVFISENEFKEISLTQDELRQLKRLGKDNPEFYSVLHTDALAKLNKSNELTQQLYKRLLVPWWFIYYSIRLAYRIVN